MVFLNLFIEFFKTGLFAVGGGLATLPFLYDIADNYSWFTKAELVDMIAVSESTPGPIGVNMATYIGYELHGIPGGIIVTVGEVLPSIICILIIARFLTSFQNRPAVKTVFTTLRPAATGLVLVAAVNIFVLALLSIPESASALKTLEGWSGLFKWKNIAFYAVATAVALKTKLHPIVLILFGALFGIMFL